MKSEQLGLEGWRTLFAGRKCISHSPPRTSFGHIFYGIFRNSPAPRQLILRLTVRMVSKWTGRSRDVRADGMGFMILTCLRSTGPLACVHCVANGGLLLILHVSRELRNSLDSTWKLKKSMKTGQTPPARLSLWGHASPCARLGSPLKEHQQRRFCFTLDEHIWKMIFIEPN